MRYKKVRIIAILLLFFGLTELLAQEAILTAGGNYTGSGGSLCYSVGQVVYTLNTGSNGSVAQGVQQPFEISVVTGIEEARSITLQYLAYPNPTTDFIILKLGNYETENLTYQLYDVSGRLLESKKLKGKETSISMVGFVASTYIIKLVQDNSDIKSFKIIKH